MWFLRNKCEWTHTHTHTQTDRQTDRQTHSHAEHSTLHPLISKQIACASEKRPDPICVRPWELYKQAIHSVQASSPTFHIKNVCCQSIRAPNVCHSTRAPTANLPNSAQLGGTPYHSPKLHLGPCSSAAMRRGRHTIHFTWLCQMWNVISILLYCGWDETGK